MLHTVDLDLERSKTDCPKKDPPGGKHIKRIRCRRDLCTWDATQQYRVDVNNQEQVRKLENSYTIHHFIYTEQPQVVVEDPSNSKRYIGVAGHQRNTAQDHLGWDIILYDVVEFDSPLDQLEYGYISNQIHAPAQESTIEDLAKGVGIAVEDKLLPNEDDAIRKHINKIASDKTEPQRKNIFKKFRSKKSAHESMLPLDGKAANKLASNLEIPYGGDNEESYNATGLYGFIKEAGRSATLMHDGLKIWLEYDEPIYVTGYITHPKPATIHDRRKSWEKEIVRLNDMLYNVACKLTGLPLVEVRKLNRSPFKSYGFLPQIRSKDVTKGGRNQEEGLVDVNGKPIEIA